MRPASALGLLWLAFSCAHPTGEPEMDMDDSEHYPAPPSAGSGGHGGSAAHAGSSGLGGSKPAGTAGSGGKTTGSAGKSPASDGGVPASDGGEPSVAEDGGERAAPAGAQGHHLPRLARRHRGALQAECELWLDRRAELYGPRFRPPRGPALGGVLLRVRPIATPVIPEPRRGIRDR